MARVGSDYQLREDQRADPLVWVAQPRALPVTVDAGDAALELAFGAGASRKLKSWGHGGEHGVHWLVTRSGTTLHTDPAYPRFTHHLIVRNDGFRLRGIEDAEHRTLVPGVTYCLDAHSPHQVVEDRRLTGFALRPALYKVQVAVDSDEPLGPEETWDLLVPMLGRGLREGAADVAKAAPAARSW